MVVSTRSRGIRDISSGRLTLFLFNILSSMFVVFHMLLKMTNFIIIVENDKPNKNPKPTKVIKRQNATVDKTKKEKNTDNTARAAQKRSPGRKRKESSQHSSEVGSFEVESPRKELVVKRNRTSDFFMAIDDSKFSKLLSEKAVDDDTLNLAEFDTFGSDLNFSGEEGSGTSILEKGSENSLFVGELSEERLARFEQGLEDHISSSLSQSFTDDKRAGRGRKAKSSPPKEANAITETELAFSEAEFPTAASPVSINIKPTAISTPVSNQSSDLSSDFDLDMFLGPKTKSTSSPLGQIKWLLDPGVGNALPFSLKGKKPQKVYSAKKAARTTKPAIVIDSTPENKLRGTNKGKNTRSTSANTSALGNKSRKVATSKKTATKAIPKTTKRATSKRARASK
ncbi:hypothetical protein AX774_g761 [Zancudomyces culisetae]|uniref:Uncharacterized protein n=1 Tax=Zancudomyces culisetae TaxID=1213189 RepID=A0A1R1PXL4_ZANCU|nr:hypothetical protein AX774_g761 [Zancudomyces culisetae]|eukprot:OMH85682.1 hypothetical protein AX774_g761 [Zancudomyces culisetae]